jgi:hypothetical protein
MNSKTSLHGDFDEPLIWIYDPRFPAATAAELAANPLADFDRPMAVVNGNELASMVERGSEIEFV